MYQWIKVDADSMPPDMEPVIVTVEYDGKRQVIPDYRWNQKNNCWEWLCEACAGCWEFANDNVTHWMPYPAPAQD